MNKEIYQASLINKTILELRGGNEWVNFALALLLLAMVINSDPTEAFNQNIRILVNILGIPVVPEGFYDGHNQLKQDFTSHPKLNT